MAILQNKILYYQDRYKTHAPVTADIYLTEVCSNNCPDCTYQTKIKGSKTMSFELFEEVVERCAELGVKGYILTGGGEPLLNPEVNNIVKWLEDEGIPYGINTTFQQYLSCRPRFLKVSLDGWGGDSYAERKGLPPGKGAELYTKVKQNIYRFYEHSEGQTNLGIQLLVRSPADIVPFYEANKDLPVNYILFAPLSMRQPYYSKEVAEQIKEAVQELKAYDSRVVCHYYWDLLKYCPSCCETAWARITILPDAKVIYCCHKPQKVIGSIFDANILEAKEAYKNSMEDCEFPCVLTGANYTMNNHNFSEDMFL